MLKIFISGPYTKGDVAQNVKMSMEVTNQLIDLGFAPYCPHLTHFLHMNNFQPYEKWLELDIEYMILCDAILRIPGDSAGADKEVELAKKRGILVFYDINQILLHYKV
ncbi:MAG: hypothetical protein ACI9JN_000392 [Bacteroidia bacterium]|jgi:hypothetical protein